MAWHGGASAAQLNLTWTDTSDNEDGFSIERKTGLTGTFAQIATVGPNVTSYTDSTLTAGTTYCYRVRAFNAAGYSAYSNEVCNTTPQNFSLTVVKVGIGSGTVSSTPAGITCGTNCSAPFPSGTSVTLATTAAAGSTFTGWSGGGCGGTGSCTVTLTATTVVIATYADSTAPTVAITAPTSSPTYSTGSSALTLGGTAADNVGVTQVTWTNNRGGSGTATGTTFWTASGIALQLGTNVLTVTAQDAAGNTTTAALTISYADTTSPTVAITAPTSNPIYSTTTSSLTLGGTASDNIGVTQVTWTNDLGGSGTATGTTTWSASGITLQLGTNVLTVTARDAAGNMTTATLTVDYQIASGGSSAAWTAGEIYVDPNSLAMIVLVSDTVTAPYGASGNSSASDSMFNANGTLFYLHLRNVGTFLYSADRSSGQVARLGQLPGTTSAGDPLAYDGAPWDPTNPNVLYAIVMSTTRRELWQLTLPLPGSMTLLHDFSAEIPTGGYPSSRVQMSPDGRYFVIAASSTGGPGTYDYVAVWDRQTGGSIVVRPPSGLGGQLLRSVVFYTGGAQALLETVDATGRTDVVLLVIPLDASLPSVSFSSPASGATVAGTLNVTTSMSDNVGVTRVQYYLDGALVGTYAPPVTSFAWDSTTVNDGSHTWRAVAYDAFGNSAQATVTFTVKNHDTTPPSVSFSSPASGATVAGTVTVRATMTDNVGVTRVQYSLDGTVTGTYSPPVGSFSWDSTTVADGSHTWKAVASDAEGNTAQTTVTFTVKNRDTTPPSVSFSSPASGATVAGVVSVMASMTDNVGVTRVQYYLDGALVGTYAPPVGSFSWNSTTVSDGSHTWTAVASDAAGNSAQATVTFTVLNAPPPPPPPAPDLYWGCWDGSCGA